MALYLALLAGRVAVDGHFVCDARESGRGELHNPGNAGGEEVEVRLLRTIDRGRWAVSPMSA